ATKGAHYLDVQDAIKKFQSGDIEGARALLESAKEKTPALSPPSIMMAQLFLSASRAQQARAELEKAVKDPTYMDDPEAYALIADLAFAEGRMAEARQMYYKVLQVMEKVKEGSKRTD